MATYVNNLRLKEITTGDEDGTWGTSTNTNLELITDALGYGTKAFAADSNETFTMPDATADGTRALYLKFTSGVSLTSTRTATIGPNTVSKMWMVENATTGGQSIIIKQGSGAEVTIATGEKTWLYTDGAGAGAAVALANPTETGTGTVTSVQVAGGTTGLSYSGGPITTSGTNYYGWNFGYRKRWNRLYLYHLLQSYGQCFRYSPSSQRWYRGYYCNAHAATTALLLYLQRVMCILLHQLRWWMGSIV